MNCLSETVTLPDKRIQKNWQSYPNLHRFAHETNKTVQQISREAMDEMMLYNWPGNIRELENAIERAVVVAKERKIMPQDHPIFRPEYF